MIKKLEILHVHNMMTWAKIRNAACTQQDDMGKKVGRPSNPSKCCLLLVGWVGSESKLRSIHLRERMHVCLCACVCMCVCVCMRAR